MFDKNGPKDPAGNHFPDFHHDHLKELEKRATAIEGRVTSLEARRSVHWQRISALEYSWEIYKVHAEALGAHLDRIIALEGARNFDGALVKDLQNRMAALEAALEDAMLPR
jgi:hypothetical protein